jgi:Fe-S cluster assembly iron-binding protein IscA
MNVYVATHKNMVGMVITGDHNGVYYYKAFYTQTDDKESQIRLAAQRAVSYTEVNKVLVTSKHMNVYSDMEVDFTNDEYAQKYGYTFANKKVETEIDKQRMLLANVEIEMQLRRNWLIGKER